MPFVAGFGSVNWYCPEPGGFSSARPMTGQVAIGAVKLLVERTEKLKPEVLVKLNWNEADAPEPTIWLEPGRIVIGKLGETVVTRLVALKFKLSMA